MNDEIIDKYTFRNVKDDLFENKDFKENLTKWGLSNLTRLKFRFDIQYQSYNTETFLKTLINQNEIKNLLKKNDGLKKINYKIKKCSLLNFNFIDFFYEKSNLKRINPRKWLSKRNNSSIL